MLVLTIFLVFLSSPNKDLSLNGISPFYTCFCEIIFCIFTLMEIPCVYGGDLRFFP